MIEIAITPNRPDALGVRGIARDLAARGLGVMKSCDVEVVPATVSSDLSGRHRRGYIGWLPRVLRSRDPRCEKRPIPCMDARRFARDRAASDSVSSSM